MLSKLWARVTGGDKDKKYPDQQTERLGKIGDLTVIYPYGIFCDLPDGALLFMLDEKAAQSVTSDRPDDVERGEPVFYHPVMGSRVIFRNNGDIDVKAGAGNVNIEAGIVNVKAADSVNIDSPVTNLGVGGAPIARQGDSVEVTVIGGSSAGTHQGTITGGGSNTSI